MSDLMHAGRSPWAATPLIALASFLGLWGLATMVQLGSWRSTVAGLLAGVAVAIVIARLLTRSRLVPTLVGAATAVLLSVPAFARSDDGSVHVLPTPGALRDLAAAVQDGVTYSAVTTAPAEVTRPLLALISVLVLAVFVIAEHLAVSWRASATAGLLLLIPWLPSVILQYRVSAVALVVAIASWVLVLGLTKRTAYADRLPSFGSAATATLATVIAIALVAPSTLGANGWGMIPRFSTPQSFDTATRLNLALDLRNSLTVNSSSPVLLYVTTGDHPDTLRLYTLTDFDGAAWSRDDPSSTDRAASSGVLWPTAVDDWTNRNRDRLNIQVLSLAERNLPVPGVPRTVDIGSEWSYVPGLDEIVTDGAGTQNQSYSVLADLSYFDAAALRAIDASSAADAADGIDKAYTEVPPAVDLARVRALADEITADAENRYDSALAIQTYLRSSANFTYDTSVKPTGADTVSTFLDNRSGYCVQFATTMVTMLRSLDIPARLAVGFLAGKQQSDGAYVVKGGDAHAWPEVYFSGVGWVRFEPTPAVQTGGVPSYANPNSTEIPVPQSVIDAAQNGEPAPPPVTIDGNGGTDTPSTPKDQAPAVPWWIFAVVAALLAAGAMWWWLRRRSSTGVHSGDGPEAAWAQLRASVGEEFEWPDSLTPDEAERHLNEAMRRLGGGFTITVSDALHEVVNAVSDHRYSPHGTSHTKYEIIEWVRQIVGETRAVGETDSRDRPVRVGVRTSPRGDS